MKCPSCSIEINEFINKCEICGFLAPDGKYFVNDNSYKRWLGQTCKASDELLPENIEKEKLGAVCVEKKIYGNIVGPYYLEVSRLYYSYDPKNYNTKSPLFSYENPMSLRCTSKQIFQDCHWICNIMNRSYEIVLASGTAYFEDLLFATIDGERYYFIVFEETEITPSKKEKKKAILQKSHLYYRYDPRNYNSKSPLWSYENPKALRCTSEQLNQDCCWSINIEKEKYEVILLGGTASFGDLLFATIDGERKYFIVFQRSADPVSSTKTIYSLEKSKLYYKYDPRNFNSISSVFSAENPMVLKYIPEQLKKGSQWSVQIDNDTVDISVSAGVASYGDLFFATIHKKRYYFIFL